MSIENDRVDYAEALRVVIMSVDNDAWNAMRHIRAAATEREAAELLKVFVELHEREAARRILNLVEPAYRRAAHCAGDKPSERWPAAYAKLQQPVE